MKKVFKKQLFAVILMIAMVLGIFPLSQAVKVEAAVPTNNTIFYDSEFSNHVDANIKCIKDFAGKSASVKKVNIWRADNFREQWNAMTYEQNIVVIDTHGTPDGFEYTTAEGYDAYYLTASSISSLNFKQIQCIVLIGCNCGHYDRRNNNIAKAFANRFRCPVIAADGTVHDYEKKKYVLFGPITGVKYQPQSDSKWKEYISAARKNQICKGWLVYVPDSGYGKVYQIGGGRYSLGDLLKANRDRDYTFLEYLTK